MIVIDFNLLSANMCCFQMLDLSFVELPTSYHFCWCLFNSLVCNFCYMFMSIFFVILCHKDYVIVIFSPLSLSDLTWEIQVCVCGGF